MQEAWTGVGPEAAKPRLPTARTNLGSSPREPHDEGGGAEGVGAVVVVLGAGWVVMPEWSAAVMHAKGGDDD